MKAILYLFTIMSVMILTPLQSALAQQAVRIHRLGVLISASDVIAPFTDAFRQGLRELGYVEGRNYVLEIRGGGAETARLSDLAAELIHLKVDIIVTAGRPALDAAMKATSTIPIIMRTGGDPVRAGLVASLARPGGNVTGVYAMSVELSGKRLELLAEVIPQIKRIAVLTVSSKFEATDEYREMEAAARALGVRLQVLRAIDPETIDNAFLAMTKERAEALVEIPHARYVQHRERISNHVTKNHLPTIYAHGVDVEKGGLMSYGVNYAAQYRRTAFYADKILKGAKPAELPVEQPMKFEFVINLKTAKQISLTIPPNVLVRADKVIR
jgi:putative ABC transport system substrate-binding protein